MSREYSIQIETEVDRNPKMIQVYDLIKKGLKSGAVVVTLSRPKRTKMQNNLLWALLGEISRQVNWYGQKLSPEDWKNVCTASLTKQEAVPGIDGGVVMVGTSTSKMTKQQFSALIEVIYAFGCQQGVKFKQDTVNEYLDYMGNEHAKVS
jgi:hypothetical protein